MNKNTITKKLEALRKSSIKDFQSNYYLTSIDDNCITFKNNEAIIFLSKERHFYKLFYANIKYLDLWYDTQNKKAERMYNTEQFQPLNQFNFCYKKV